MTAIIWYNYTVRKQSHEREFIPAYLKQLASGGLAARVQDARDRLGSCTLCPRGCRVNRLQDFSGAGCKTGVLARVASYGPHFGEEAPLRGIYGSGTIFFGGCNLRCVYCQNFSISQMGHGQVVTAAELATMMLQLQEEGCHNINLVSPSHIVPHILEALLLAAQAGLKVPLVYNTGGYDSLETLALLDGVIDIYMPDMKYSDPGVGRRLSSVPDYPSVNQAAVREMHRQVGDLVLDRNDIAQRGLLVRHLVLPNELAGTGRTVTYLAGEISAATWLNVMDQYRPAYQVGLDQNLADLERPITRDEYRQARRMAVDAGLTRLM